MAAKNIMTHNFGIEKCFQETKHFVKDFLERASFLERETNFFEILPVSFEKNEKYLFEERRSSGRVL